MSQKEQCSNCKESHESVKQVPMKTGREIPLCSDCVRHLWRSVEP